MTKFRVPSSLACAALVCAGASLATAAHAQNSPTVRQKAQTRAAHWHKKTKRSWTSSKSSTHSWTNPHPMGTVMGSPMGARREAQKQKCSHEAFIKGLWGSAREHFMNKCLMAHSWISDPRMGAAMGSPMGATGRTKAQQCSHEALTRGLSGNARRHFMKKCLKVS